MKPSVAEKSLLDDFKGRAHTYLEQQLIPVEDGEWLALMQHFGAPTRLLDVTASPYVAAYFAMESIPRGVDQCAVWAINPNWFIEASGALQVPPDKEKKEAMTKLVADALKLEPSDLVLRMAYGLELTLGGAKNWFGATQPMVLPFTPKRLSERLSVQQGSFLVPRSVDMSFMDNLKALGSPKAHVTKILISAEQRGRALAEMRLMNITRASLFPGLEGYAQSLRTALVSEPEQSRNIRLALRGLRI